MKLREKLRLETWHNGGKREGLEGPRNGRGRLFAQALSRLSGLVFLMVCGGFEEVSDDVIGGGGREEGGEGRGGAGGMLVQEELEETSQGVMKLLWRAVEIGG